MGLLVVAVASHLVWDCAAAEWHQEPGYRWDELNVPSGGKTGFRLLTPEETGITFTNILEERTGEGNRVLFNGSGVAIGDIDHDGRPDIFFCSLDGHNALYRNLGGFKFKDITEGSGIVCTNHFCRGAVFADINGDGHLDLLIATTGNGVLCFLNDGQGHFQDITQTAGTATRYGSVTMALADVDGNGTLDLYVANNRTDDIRDHGQVDLQMVGGKLSIPPALRDRLVLINGKLAEYGEPDLLYLNDGQGHFSPVPWTNGTFLDEQGQVLTSTPLDWGLTATFRDFTGDGSPDLYVCNDYWTPDRIWINDGHGHFRAADNSVFRHTSASSMGVDMADLTRSGNLDIMVVDMLSRDLRLRKRQMMAQNPIATPAGVIDNRPQIMRNTLFQSRGDGTFAEIAEYAGVPASEWSWSPMFLDVDLDGYPDLLIPAGHSKDVQDMDAEAQIRARNQVRTQLSRIQDPKARLEAFVQNKIENSHLYPRLDMPVVAFHNLGHYRFEETTSTWGTDSPGVHHALAAGDLDGDGGLDLVVNNLGSAAGIYRNQTSAPRVAVRLRGAKPNTQGIGAKIKLLGGTVPMQGEEIIAGGRYMAGSEALAVFAPGKVREGLTLQVAWRTGKVSTIEGVKANRIYEIDETSAQDAAPISPPVPQPLFEDVSQHLSHQHHEEDFNDFERQPLLPRKLSQLGPGVAWADLDGDGWDDLVIGSGRGGQTAFYLNNKHGGFERMVKPELKTLAARDQGAIAVCPGPAHSLEILAASSDYEDPVPGGGGLNIYQLGKSAAPQDLHIKDQSVGALALADVEGKGELSLFVGGRVIPGRYPEAASSKIYRRRSDRWELDQENAAVLQGVGLVSGAVWSDLDGDGFPELILACEWGPIRVFKNQAGKLSEITDQLGLSAYTGWWNGVTTGDIDGSGRLAIIASNWGLNTPYHPTTEHPVALYYGDFFNRGTVDLIEAEYDPALRDWAPRRMRDVLAAALPDLPARFPTRKSFSEANIKQVLGPLQTQAHKVSVNTLASMAFLNRGQKFEARPLPMGAQLAPGFSVNVADFDGDGAEDIFLSQNFFANQPEIPRHDAGRGLILKGDGAASFSALPGTESGIAIYGEQRGAAVADYDHDGRVDLVVTQNGAATRLFHNARAKPGLRVRLIGPRGNPAGIGAQVRLLFGAHNGPVREIHAGSGYWSQDSLAIVLSLPEPPSGVWVRWPGGRTATYPLSGTEKETSLEYKEIPAGR